MAIRIDTLRNRIDGTIARLNEARAELDDLHLLAYSRHHAGERQRVSGGSISYALDTHGDPKAREALRELSDALVDVLDALDARLQESSKPMRRGSTDTTGRRDESARATAQEVAEAIAAQERRRARGEYVPVATQPQRTPTLVDQAPQLKALAGAVRKTAKAGVRPDRSRLTPLEYAAWRSAATS